MVQLTKEQQNDLYRRKVALGEVQGEKTGYASIDKPWLKYYSEEAINAELPNCSLYEYLWENNKDYLNEYALNYFGRKITYGKMFFFIDRVASALATIGVKRGDIVTITLPNIPESVYFVYALNKLGAIANLVDLRAKGSDLINYYREVNTTIAIVSDLFVENTIDIIDKTAIKNLIVISLFESFPKIVKIILKKKKGIEHNNIVVYSWKDFLKEARNEQMERIASGYDDVACILHTSGTTGSPKGVMLTNRNINAMVVQYRKSGIEFKAGDKFMNQVPPFLAYGMIMATHLPLSLHMQTILLPQYQPHKFAENVMKTKPNHVIAGPADWGNFLENKKVNKVKFSFLKTLASGSDTMSIKCKKEVNTLMERQGCRNRIIEGYGMTEAGAAACTNLPHCDVEGSVGIPLPKTILCIYDNELQEECTYNQRGEICICGPTVMKGYFGGEKETQNVLKYHKDGKIWLHSGDLGYISEDGCVYIEGRLKRIIVKFDGCKVSPFSIEKIILQNKYVSGCSVVGKADRKKLRGQIPIAYITLNEEGKQNEKVVLTQIRTVCEEEFNERYRPIDYVVIDELPLTPNGKVDYKALEE